MGQSSSCFYKTMRYFFLITFLLIGCVEMFKNKHDLESNSNLISRLRRQVSITQNDLTCESRVCKDCRGSCDGCKNCGLCGLIQTTCDAGLKELKLGGLTSVTDASIVNKDQRNVRRIVWLEKKNLPANSASIIVQSLKQFINIISNLFQVKLYSIRS